MNTFCGTVDYLAPEMITMKEQKPQNQGYGKEIDIWAIGIIAYALMSGKLPFRGDNGEPDKKTMDRIVNDGIFFDKVWRMKSSLGI
jgi:serine/threonine protein kinase